MVFLPPSRNRKWAESGKAPEQGLPSLLPGSLHLRRVLRGAVSAWIAVISPGAVPHSSDVFQGPGGFPDELFSTPGNCCCFLSLYLLGVWACAPFFFLKSCPFNRRRLLLIEGLDERNGELGCVRAREVGKIPDSHFKHFLTCRRARGVRTAAPLHNLRAWMGSARSAPIPAVLTLPPTSKGGKPPYSG